MVRLEMLTVGRELLVGRTVNTNAHWVGARLARMGTMLDEVTTVDDDLGEIASSLRESLRRSPDFLIVVGGLGPTPDDMTLKGIAEGLGIRMKPSSAALSLIREHYVGRGLGDLELTPARRKMALIPIGSEPVKNEVGTAPGVRIRARRTTIFCLPGVPAEMKSIFSRSVEPEIRKKLGKLHRKSVTMKVEGILESALAPLIAAQLRRHPNAYIKSHPRGIREGVSRIELDVAAVGKNAKRTDAEVLRIAGEMREALTKSGATIKSVRGASQASGA